METKVIVHLFFNTNYFSKYFTKLVTNATDLEFLLGKGKYDTESIWSALKNVFGEYVTKEDISRCTEDQWKQIGLSLGAQNALKSWACKNRKLIYFLLNSFFFQKPLLNM